MEIGLISIIVPVYQMEEYIDRCIESLVAQSYSKFEVLLIDDGSTDSSPSICDEWAMRDSRIRVIHKENQGLGLARNTGIENARGQYIVFCDSDDYLSKDALALCYDETLRSHAEIVCYGFYIESQTGKIQSEVRSSRRYVYNSKGDILNKFVPGMLGFNPLTGETIGVWMSLCGCMISKEVIQKSKWRCESERVIISEDVYSLLRLYKNLESAAVIDVALYHYCENTNSLTHMYREDRYKQIEHFYTESIRLCKTLGYSELVVHELTQPYLCYTITALKQICASKYSICTKYTKLKAIFISETMQSVLEIVKNDRFPLKQKMFWNAIRKHLYVTAMLMIQAKGVGRYLRRN